MVTLDKYIGQSGQLSGVEEVTLSRGKGKGMTLLQVRNGKGLFVTLSADRAMDISRVYYDGVNMGYFGACGYVAPTFYDQIGAGFLKSFTAGFLTTCGLTAVGSPCHDCGEDLPLHGTISNTPCENFMHYETESEIVVEATVRDAAVFGNKLLLIRKFIFSKESNTLTVEDTIKNIGTQKTPCMILYHFNMGYPLLSENAIVNIPHTDIKPRNEHAGEGINTALMMEEPQADYEEMCFYYDVKADNDEASVGIFNPDINKGLKMTYSKNTLDKFTQWKMMGENEYVLGLEPGNCTPDGRNVLRENGTLKFIEAGEEYKTKIRIEFTDKGEIIKGL